MFFQHLQIILINYYSKTAELTLTWVATVQPARRGHHCVSAECAEVILGTLVVRVAMPTADAARVWNHLVAAVAKLVDDTVLRELSLIRANVSVPV